MVVININILLFTLTMRFAIITNENKVTRPTNVEKMHTSKKDIQCTDVRKKPLSHRRSSDTCHGKNLTL